MSDILKNYIYVDAHYESVKDGRRTRWVRMKTSDLGKLIVTPSSNTNCYATVQRYRDATSLREVTGKAPQNANGEASGQAKGFTPSDEDFAEGQLHYHGLYFDFDCRPSDLEGSEEERGLEAVRRSLEDARKVVGWFQSAHRIPDQFIQCWFSGMKGFHVEALHT